MGIRLIIYLDDILIMTESRALAQKHTAKVVNLLTSLRFVINNDKSIFKPTQERVSAVSNQLSVNEPVSPWGKDKVYQKRVPTPLEQSYSRGQGSF